MATVMANIAPVPLRCTDEVEARREPDFRSRMMHGYFRRQYFRRPLDMEQSFLYI